MRFGFVFVAIPAGFLTLAGARAQPSPGAAPERPPKISLEASELATRLFRDGCVLHLGDAAASEAALKQAGFYEAGHPMQEFMTEGRPGNVWMVDRPPVAMAAVTRPDGSECTLVTQRAVLAVNEGDFRAMAAGLASGDIATELPDNPRLPEDPMRVVSYRLRGDPASGQPDRLIALRLDATPRSFFPVKMTASIVKPPAPPTSLDASAPPGKQP